jgi:hypothetical protein
MKTEYDLSKMKSCKNPDATKLKKSVTIQLSEDARQTVAVSIYLTA